MTTPRPRACSQSISWRISAKSADAAAIKYAAHKKSQQAHSSQAISRTTTAPAQNVSVKQRRQILTQGTFDVGPAERPAPRELPDLLARSEPRHDQTKSPHVLGPPSHAGDGGPKDTVRRRGTGDSGETRRRRGTGDSRDWYAMFRSLGGEWLLDDWESSPSDHNVPSDPANFRPCIEPLFFQSGVRATRGAL